MNILEEADRIINGERRQAYGPVKTSFERVAKMWTAILGTEVSSQQVALMMIAFKIAREVNAHKDDNLVDIAGYTALLHQLYKDDPIKSWTESAACSDLSGL